MGLDLYVGTLARYHTGDWETEAQRIGRQAGFPVQILYAEGAPRRLWKVTAPLSISLWRRRLRTKIASVAKGGLDWPEDKSQPYLSRKPDHDARQALVLAAAYAERPELARPEELPATNDADPAYAAASKHYIQSMISVFECHMFVPSDDNFLTVLPDPVGVERFITSTFNLGRALGSVNDSFWHAGEQQIEAWAERGPFSKSGNMLIDGKLVRGDPEQPEENSFEHTAQFGFAIYHQALRFSRTHNLPILTDE